MNALPTFAAEVQLTLVHDRSRELMTEAHAQRLGAATIRRGSVFASAVRLLRDAVSRPASAPSGILPRLEDQPYRS